MTTPLPFLCLNWRDPEDRVLQTLRALGKNVSVESAIHCACENDYVKCLRYIHENADRDKLVAAWDVRVCITAASHGSICCLRYADTNGCLCDERVAAAAAKSGSEECLRYLLDRGYPVDASVCAEACKYGALACLKLARSRGVPWDADASGWAASIAHMPCLEYLLEHGCPFDVDGFAMAIESMVDGPPSMFDTHLSCLKYLVSRGCPWSRRVLVDQVSDELAAEFPTVCPWDDNDE